MSTQWALINDVNKEVLDITIWEYLENNFNNNERLFIKECFSLDTYNKWKKIKNILKNTLKIYSKYIKTSRYEYKSLQNKYDKSNHKDNNIIYRLIYMQENLNKLCKTYRQIHVLYSCLNGNKIQKVDPNFKNTITNFKTIIDSIDVYNEDDMKQLYENDLKLNDLGREVRNKIKCDINRIIKSYSYEQFISIRSLKMLLNDIIDEEIANMSDHIEYHLNKVKKTNVTELIVVNKKDGSIKYQQFLGYDSETHPLFEYDELYKPTVPCGIKNINGEKVWYLYNDIKEE